MFADRHYVEWLNIGHMQWQITWWVWIWFAQRYIVIFQNQRVQPKSSPWKHKRSRPEMNSADISLMVPIAQPEHLYPQTLPEKCQTRHSNFGLDLHPFAIYSHLCCHLTKDFHLPSPTCILPHRHMLLPFWQSSAYLTFSVNLLGSSLNFTVFQLQFPRIKEIHLTEAYCNKTPLF